MISDITLINQIKTDNDSAAVTELVNRHTGIYVNVVKKYSCYPDFVARANVTDLRDEKFFNIYQWALKYDPTRATESGKPMQFGSYVGEMTKYLCQSLLYRGQESIALNEDIAPTNDTGITEQSGRDLAIEEIKNEVNEVESDLFKRIFNARFCGQKPQSWRKVGEAVNMSHEGARRVFERHIGAVREHLST